MSFSPCLPCKVGQCEGCTEGLCSCIEFHATDETYMRNFKRIKQEQRNEQRQQEKAPFCPTVHYGRWHMPDGKVQMTRLVTIPRNEDDVPQWNPERAAWPSR